MSDDGGDKSGNSGKPGGAQTSGRGTHGGGNMDVVNQGLLVIGAHVAGSLSDGQVQQLALVQIAFARDVSQAAADAYTKLLALLDPAVAVK